MRKVFDILNDRYFEIAVLSDSQTRIWAMLEAMERNVDDWPIDKTNRWIGFVQGILFSEGLLDLDEERDFTRPIFHDYYKRNGIEIPDSIEV